MSLPLSVALPLFVAAGVCGIASALLLRQRKLLLWQVCLVVAAAAAAVLVSAADAWRAALVIALASWVIHLVGTWTLVQALRKR